MAIGDGVLEIAIARMASCDTVINCLQNYGKINAKNKLLVEEAVIMGLKIFRDANELCREKS